MSPPLADRIALVTGASRGIGYATALALAKAGAHIIALARTYAAETATTNVRVNLFTPGPIRTRMRAQAFPGEDPMTLEAPDKVADSIVALCLPSIQESGKLYAYRDGRFLQFHPPS